MQQHETSKLIGPSELLSAAAAAHQVHQAEVEAEMKERERQEAQQLAKTWEARKRVAVACAEASLQLRSAPADWAQVDHSHLATPLGGQVVVRAPANAVMVDLRGGLYLAAGFAYPARESEAPPSLHLAADCHVCLRLGDGRQGVRVGHAIVADLAKLGLLVEHFRKCADEQPWNSGDEWMGWWRGSSTCVKCQNRPPQ